MYYRFAGAVLSTASYPLVAFSSTDEVPHMPKLLSSAMNRRDTNLQRGFASKPGRVGRLHRPKETSVIRIALTGGPCGGKSSSLEHLTARGNAEGFDVLRGPECATIMFNSGFHFPTDPTDPRYDEMLFAFQKNLLKLQLQVERTMTAVAASTGRPSILVFDRGLLDTKGYMPPEMWARALDEIDEGRGVSEDYVIKRYDGVVHLVTAANGAVAFYKWGKVIDDSGGAVFRKESPEEAIELDERMQQCWKDHPRHVVVGNGSDFSAKICEATEAILEIARVNHPQN